jgi:phage terminase small subunit
MARTLSTRQQLFIAAMQRGVTGTQAAIEAGYSAHSAKSRAHVLMTNERVSAELARVREKLAAEAEYNGTKCMAELDNAITFALETKQPNAYVKAIELRARLAGLLRDKLDITVEQKVDLAGALAEARERSLRLRCDSDQPIEGDFVALPQSVGHQPPDKQSGTEFVVPLDMNA